jgi:hypothetical protein
MRRPFCSDRDERVNPFDAPGATMHGGTDGGHSDDTSPQHGSLEARETEFVQANRELTRRESVGHEAVREALAFSVE